MKLTVSDQQWQKYLEKYQNLMWTVARKISGDNATANLEDNFSDICIAAMNSIDSYCKKESMSVDEALDHFGFDKYTKTVLWNHKNKKGALLTKKMPFRGRHFSIDAPIDGNEDLTFDIEDKSFSASSVDQVTRDYFDDYNEDVQKIVQAILTDPNVVDSNGEVKLAALIKPTGLTIATIRNGVSKIKRLLTKELRNEQ